MTEHEEQEPKDLAYRVRRHVVGMAKDGGCFIGASLSCVDLLANPFLDERWFKPSLPKGYPE